MNAHLPNPIPLLARHRFNTSEKSLLLSRENRRLFKLAVGNIVQNFDIFFSFLSSRAIFLVMYNLCATTLFPRRINSALPPLVINFMNVFCCLNRYSISLRVFVMGQYSLKFTGRLWYQYWRCFQIVQILNISNVTVIGVIVVYC